MAKSLFTSAGDSGVDLTDPDQVQGWMEEFNAGSEEERRRVLPDRVMPVPKRPAREAREAQTPRRRVRAQRSRRHLRSYRGNSSPRGLPITLIVDAGPLYAYVDADDDHHKECLELLETHPGPLLVPELVITEVVYLLATRLGVEPEIRFLGDFASGNLIAYPVAAGDWLRIAELAGTYRDLPLGIVDASVVAAAERLGEHEIATLDRRHFNVVRPTHRDAFSLLP